MIEYRVSPSGQPIDEASMWLIEAELQRLGVRTLGGHIMPLEPDEAARLLVAAMRSLGGPGSGRYPKGSGKMGYHVTSTKAVKSIQKKGITQFNPSNWVKGHELGDRYGEGEVYAFEHEGDAINWAAKMDWAKNQGFGTGKISIVEFDAEDWEGWTEDEADPISHAGAVGKWYKKMGGVPSKNILGSVPIGKTHVEQLRKPRKEMKLRDLGGPGSGRYPKGSGQNPLHGEAPGQHTPEGMKKLIGYLETKTGEKFRPHGSVAKGGSSVNDFDLVMDAHTEEEEQAASDAHNEEMANIWDKVAAGTLTQDEAMEQIYGDKPHPIDQALMDIGFVSERSVAFDASPTGTAGDPEVEVHRYHNPKTGHSIEIWVPLLPARSLGSPDQSEPREAIISDPAGSGVDQESESFSDPLRDLGGPGSGRYPKGSGRNPQAGMPQSWTAGAVKPDGNKLRVTGKVSPKMAQKVFGLDKPSEASAHMTMVAAGMIEHIPGEVTVEWTQATSGRNAIFMKVTSEDGLELNRTFSRRDDGSLVVHHEVFRIPMSAQGSGLAKTVLADSYDTYMNIGVDRIETHANLDVGGYAWARFGFKADDPADLANQLMERAREMPPRLASRVKKIIETHAYDPNLPWIVAGITDGDDKVGKGLLLDSEWDGTLDLSDVESTRRFEYYVKRRP